MLHIVESLIRPARGYLGVGVAVALAATAAPTPGAATPATTAPPPPAHAGANGSGPVDVWWDPPSGTTDVASYQVSRDGERIATVPAGVTTYRDSALRGGTSYTYSIRTVDAAGAVSAPTTTAPVRSAPLIRFTAGSAESVEGVIEGNRPVLIDYDPARLSRCRAEYAGGDAWSIGVRYRIDGGEVQDRPVTELGGDRRQRKVLLPVDLPLGARELRLWFHAGDRTGCSEHDANYRFAVDQPPVVTYGADWSETVDGQIRAGRGFVVRYDPARLPQCRDTYMGRPAWQIDVRHRFDGGPELSTTMSDGRGGVPPRTIDVPAGARRVETWFLVYGQRSGCTAYDSDHGRNYTFAVVDDAPPPAAVSAAGRPASR